MYILLPILILLIGVSLYLSSTSKGKEKDPVMKEEYSFNIKQDEVKKISITNEQGSFSIVKEDGQNDWTIQSDDDNKQGDSVRLFEYVNKLTSIHPNEKLDNSDQALETYGVGSDAPIIEIDTINGEKQQYTIGNQLPTGNGFYFYSNNQEEMYIVHDQVAELFHISPSYFVQERNVDVSQNDFKEVEYQVRGEKKVHIKRMESESTNIYTPYYIDSPYESKPQLEESYETFEVLMTSISSIRPLEKVSESKEDQSEYGLDDPLIRIRIETMNGETQSIQIGNKVDNGLYYALFNDQNDIYKASISDEQSLFQITPFELVNTAPIFTMIFQIKELTFIHQDTEYILEFIKLDQDPYNPNMQFKLNGQVVDEKEAKQFYLSLLELKADAESEHKGTGEKAELHIIANYENGEQTTIEYIPYNQNFYEISTNGMRDFVIAKEKLATILQKLERLSNKAN